MRIFYAKTSSAGILSEKCPQKASRPFWKISENRKLPTEYPRKSERDRNKMVWSSFLGTGVTERNNKSTVAKVSRLRLPLRFSLIFPLSRSPEKLFKSFEVKCRY